MRYEILDIKNDILDMKYKILDIKNDIWILYKIFKNHYLYYL